MRDAATPARSWVPNLGVLRNRVVPRGQSTVTELPGRGVPVSPWLRFLGHGPGGGGKGQEAVGPTFGRDTASEAGAAATKYIHPLVKVIIYPNLLFCYAVAPADWPGDARLDPGRTLWGQK